MKHLCLCVGFVVLVSGCASTPKMGNVIPQEGGIYQVVTSGEESRGQCA